MKMTSHRKWSFRKYRSVYHLLILTSILVPQVFVLQELGTDFLMPALVVVNASIILVHFLNIYYLIPKFLKQGKYKQYALTLLLILVSYGLTIYQVMDFGDYVVTLFNKDELVKTIRPIPIPPLLPMTLVILASVGFELLLDRESHVSNLQIAENEKLEIELKFLKSQINPHFFFNTLHNIYSLVVCKSAQAEDSILLLSDMMRYLLYENNQNRISLEKEVSFIENYLALQKLRDDDTKNQLVLFEKEGSLKEGEIEPMIFIPFIENAFKYSRSTHDSHIFIHLRVINNVLFFSLINSIGEYDLLPDKAFSGLGLLNIKKRLNILYPNKYHLNIQNNGETFQVDLSLVLI